MDSTTRKMKVRCPIEICGKVFEIPVEDRVNVVVFGNWHKYHVSKTSFTVITV